MVNNLKSKDIINILHRISAVVEEHKDFLVELDSKMGDGDLGLYMSSGFLKIKLIVKEMQDSEPSKILRKAGTILAEEAPSTMGTLLATAFLSAAKTVKGKKVLDSEDIVMMGKAACESIINRGGAKRGDKTILDSLIPAVEAMEQMSAEPLKNMIDSAYNAAVEGEKDSRNLKAVHGRPAYFGDKTIGAQDGGATMGTYLFKGLKLWADSELL